MSAPDEPVEPGADAEIRLTWIRDYPDLVAYAPLPPSGRYPRDSRQRPRLRAARLRASNLETPPLRPAGLLTDGDWSWIVASEHSWASFANRFGSHAHRLAIALAQAGCITIGHALNGNALVQPPRRVYPHPDLTAAEQQRRGRRRNDASALQAQAGELAAAIADEWPDVAGALQETTSPERLAWAVHAAQDLAAGKVHDSVRAFVQAHAEHTKVRDDVHHLLAELGFDHETLAALGLARSPYIGLGGPIRLHTGSGTLDLAGLPGPHDIRLSAQHPARLDLPASAATLLVIENRQAAETICDVHSDLPVIWCHGQPPDAVLTLIVQAAHQVKRTVICTDADLGGVRIAGRIYDHLPPGTSAQVIDVGAAQHDPGRNFNTHSRTHLQALATRTDDIGHFAQRCLDRGYAIEQEATARAALRVALERT
jgi:hypothetical protein